MPRCPLYNDLPDGVVAKLDLGRRLAPTFEELLRALIAEPELADALGDNGRAFAGGCPDVDEASDILRDELERLTDTCSPREAEVSVGSWARVATQMSRAAMPAGADEEVRRRVGALLEAHTAPFRK